jgi:DNA-binding transcriptional LysR family regulator
MDLNKLRTFIKVVEAGSISQAASVIYRTQQAISLQIKLLEEELGLPLFQRIGPKLYLTPEGELLYRKSKEHLSNLEDVLCHLKCDGKPDHGPLIVGASSELDISYLPSIITKFRNRIAGANVKIVLAADTELEDCLIDNRVDFGFLRCLRNTKLFNRHTVVSRQLIPVASPAHLTRSKPITTVEDTLDHDWIDYSTHCSAYSLWIKENARELLPLAAQKRPAIVVDSDIVQKDLVLSGNGLALLPKELIEKELAKGEIIQVLPGRIKPLVVQVDLAYKKKRTTNSTQEAFLKSLGVLTPSGTHAKLDSGGTLPCAPAPKLMAHQEQRR